MKNRNSDNDLSRRDFIKTTGVTTAALAAAALIDDTKPAHASVPRSGKIIGANDRINYAIVGVGGMGSGHLRILKDFEEKENVSVVAVCDVFEKRRRKAQEVAKIGDALVFKDYRRLLENKDIDVVVIATPDHWHAPIAIDAMESGKHIYVEKPMTHTLDEAFDLYKTAKRTRRSVQVGSHGCSDPKWHRAKEIISAKRLGRVLWAQGSYCRNNVKGEWNYDIDPEANEQTIDWKMWLGRAKNRPFSAERYFRWRKYWDYGNGIIGDLWPHRLHPLMLAMGINEFPNSVSCVGGTLCDTDTGHGEPRDVADTTMMMAGFPCGVQIFLAGSTVNERGLEDVIRGQKANMLLGGLKVEVQPERPFAEEIEGKDETPADSGETHAKHQKNFIDSLRNNVPPNCDIELGIRVQTIVSLAEKSYRTGKMMHFDPVKLKASS
ncbi:MAG TPA: Gfo/Idh/MocA family oxidoreductase [Blastocatellia bacterium]|jgi:predicted dehydrogenase|nr:Gfo/Idh/MocA family oxidoreductase [Blastocatellia bacterium]